MGSNYSPGGRGYRGRGSGGGRRNDGPKKPKKPNDLMRLGPWFWLFLIIVFLAIFGIAMGITLGLQRLSGS